MGATLLLSLPVIYCYKKHKNPFDIKWVGFFYSLYFIFIAGINISRFSYFASTTLNPNSQAWMFSIIVVACAFYGAYLGIEGLARFSAFGFSLLVASILAALILNFQNYQEINFYPVIRNSNDEMINNILTMTGNSTELALFLCLSKKVNGRAVKPYVWSLIASFFSLFVLVLFVNAVMGDAASLQNFPIYNLFQLAKVGLFERIDVLYISFWIFGIFIKSVMLIYCSGISFKPMKKSTKCVISSVLTLAIAVIFTELTQVNTLPKIVNFIPFAAFGIIIPILTLIFKKRNYGDEFIEKF